MTAPVAAYVVAIGTMLFAGLSALTLITVVKYLDQPERAAAPPARAPDQIAVLQAGPTEAVGPGRRFGFPSDKECGARTRDPMITAPEDAERESGALQIEANWIKHRHKAGLRAGRF